MEIAFGLPELVFNKRLRKAFRRWSAEAESSVWWRLWLEAHFVGRLPASLDVLIPVPHTFSLHLSFASDGFLFSFQTC